MTRAELKQWAKDKLKGNLWNILPAILVAGILTGLTIRVGSGEDKTSYSLGWLFYFVQVGLAYFMVNFIKDRKYEFNDIFHFAKDFGKCLGAGLLQSLWIFLFCLLLIVPGIIKALGFVLVPFLMADEKYKDMKIPDLLKKSEEMMNGHKMDYFMLILSFFGWFLLILPTLVFIMIYVGPYLSICQAKFLTDVKEAAEGTSGQAPVAEAQPAAAPEAPAEAPMQEASQKFCPNCGKEVQEGTVFCPECGKQIM